MDQGATKAVRNNGKSLLAVGITEVRGTFDQGASVELAGTDGVAFGRGLVNYSSSEIRRIVGLKSDQITSELGHVPYREVIHRDNLVVTSTTLPS